MMEPEPGLAKVLIDRGHYVPSAMTIVRFLKAILRALERPSREGIVSALTKAGIQEAKADSLSRECARNLTVLRRPHAFSTWAASPMGK